MKTKAIWTKILFAGFLVLSISMSTCQTKDAKSIEDSPKSPGDDDYLSTPIQPLPEGKPFEDVPEVRAEVEPVIAVEVYSTGGGKPRWFDGVAIKEPLENMTFGVDGTVEAVNLSEGTSHLYERIFMELDDTECKKQIDDIMTEIAAAEVLRLKTQREYDGKKKLFESGKIPEAELDAAAEKLEAAEENVAELKRREQQARKDLSFHDLRISKFARIDKVNVKKGDSVKADDVVAILESRMPLLITVEIPAIFIQQVGVSSSGKVKFKDASGIFPVDVISVGPVEMKPGAVFPVTVQMRNNYSYLKPGMECQVKFRFDYRWNLSRHMVPTTAIESVGEDRFVYVVKPDPKGELGTIEKRKVELGKERPFGTEVNKGLDDGELIVLDHHGRLEDGMEVRYK